MNLDPAAVAAALAALGTGIYVVSLHRRLAAQKAALDQLNRVLERESMTDELTGLMNRRQLDVEVDREIERAKRYKRSLAGLIVAIDDFDTIKKVRGPAMAEAALKKTAAVIQSCIRKVDFAGRHGDGSFLVLFPEGSMEGARIVAQRMQTKIRDTHIELPRPGLTLDAAIGLFAFQDCGFVDKDLFLETAEVSLLKAQKDQKERKDRAK